MQKKTKKPWGGRFKADLDPLVQKYTSSLNIDRRLAEYDIRGSRAHVRMLTTQGIIQPEDEKLILKGLKQIEKEIQSGEFPYREELEDIHMNIEYRLQEIVGQAGHRLHTGRSRNDQVALDLKLFCLESSTDWCSKLLSFQKIIVNRAEDLKRDLFPGWTHLQAAQPLSWGHYLLAFCEMLGRDFHRLTQYQKLHEYSPLGAGALAGSTLHLDPEQTAQNLGFPSSFGNSYDVVGDRDFVLELLQISTQLMLHVSRISEDFIYFSSTPVGWVELPDAFCTGSSMMPQKKNPDILELVRGKTASVLGHANGMAILIKGLPTSYHRDLQQDKEHLFSCVDMVTETLDILPCIVEDFKVNKEKTSQALQEGFLMATDVAEYLVSQGIPFRIAHEKVGMLVSYCSENKVNLDQLSLETIREFIPEIDSEIFERLSPESVLEKRQHKGSTGLISLEQQLNYWKGWIEKSS